MSDQTECSAGLEVTIRATTYSMRCVRVPNHVERTHRSPLGSEWAVTPPAAARTPADDGEYL